MMKLVDSNEGRHPWSERLPGRSPRIRLGGREVELRPELRQDIEARLLMELGSLTRHVEEVQVQGGSVDLRPLPEAFRCEMRAVLSLGRELVVEEVDAELKVAVDRAARALARDVDYVVSCLPPAGGRRCA